MKWFETFAGDLNDEVNRNEVLEDYVKKILVYDDKVGIIFRYTEDERVFPIQETSAIIDTEQKALEILEKRDYQGHIPDDMMDSVLGEEQPDNFFQ